MHQAMAALWFFVQDGKVEKLMSDEISIITIYYYIN